MFDTILCFMDRCTDSMATLGQHINLHVCLARYMLLPVHLSVRYTDGSVKNGESWDYAIFIIR